MEYLDNEQNFAARCADMGVQAGLHWSRLPVGYLPMVSSDAEAAVEADERSFKVDLAARGQFSHYFLYGPADSKPFWQEPGEKPGHAVARFNRVAEACLMGGELRRSDRGISAEEKAGVLLGIRRVTHQGLLSGLFPFFQLVEQVLKLTRGSEHFIRNSEGVAPLYAISANDRLELACGALMIFDVCEDDGGLPLARIFAEVRYDLGRHLVSIEWACSVGILPGLNTGAVGCFRWSVGAGLQPSGSRQLVMDRYANSLTIEKQGVVAECRGALAPVEQTEGWGDNHERILRIQLAGRSLTVSTRAELMGKLRDASLEENQCQLVANLVASRLRVAIASVVMDDERFNGDGHPCRVARLPVVYTVRCPAEGRGVVIGVQMCMVLYEVLDDQDGGVVEVEHVQLSASLNVDTDTLRVVFAGSRSNA